MMKTTSKKMCLMFMMLLAALLVFPSVNSQAASKNAKAKKAYGKFLKNHENEYQSYAIINIGSKKEPMLLVNEGGLNSTSTTIYGQLYYYTGSKVKAVKGGYVESSGTAYPLQYINHSLFVGHRWGLGSMIKVKNGYTYGTRVYLVYYNGGTKQHYYKATIKKGKIRNSDRKLISEKKYKYYEKKWKQNNSKKDRTIKMKWNTAYNRKADTGFVE